MFFDENLLLYSETGKALYEKVKELCGKSDELQSLNSFWIPAEKMDYVELHGLFIRIDTATV